MIRDTSGQDRPIAPRKQLVSKRTVAIAAASLALIALITWLALGWKSSSHVASAARLRIVAVAPGTLLRDAQVNGRVVAAISQLQHIEMPESSDQSPVISLQKAEQTGESKQ